MSEVPRLPRDPEPLVDDPFDDGKIERAKREEKRRADREREELGSVLSTTEGRAFVWRQLAPAFQVSFVGEAPLTMAFNEGIRSQANSLLADVNNYWPHRYLEMMAESRANLAKRGEQDK